ncbi:hypothetical protein JV46_23430 [Solemya velum gill symbiont]|uniref:Uncharacterized protein n=1 Tax=Solemya velum gill symbiont TaxID=2340 RepID=A0A0B0H937_SOVGS|nr:hypothetical protein JV46_23430 [Solemya velum gill symbiont]
MSWDNYWLFEFALIAATVAWGVYQAKFN